ISGTNALPRKLEGRFSFLQNKNQTPTNFSHWRIDHQQIVCAKKHEEI
ncbi:MAG: hypothetical protein RL316_991, partial [Bacteroidota bacterium]